MEEAPVEVLQFIRRYLAAIEGGAQGDELAAFFDPDVIQHEFPNRLFAKGMRRDLKQLLESAVSGSKAVRRQRYEVLNIVSSGDQIALEVLWTGTLAMSYGSIPEGGEMKAHLAIFIKLRGGKIVSQHNYDCFEPF